MKITYYGHSCFNIEVQGKHLLFDPFISANELAKSINVSKIHADFILLSHGHEDHIADAGAIAKQTDATIISNYEIVTWFGKQGLQKGHPMNIGGTRAFDFGNVKMVNAVHSSGLPDGTYGGNPGGFLVRHDHGTFYYSGDTALTTDMKLLGDHEKIDFSFLCIGDNFTMGVEDAVRAAGMIGCNKIIGMHYDTFGYIKINREEAKSKFKEAGKELFLLSIGASVNF